MVKHLIDVISLSLEALATVLIVLGAFLSLWQLRFCRLNSHAPQSARVRLGYWVALSLEFLLAADVLKTAVAPSWNDIGQLAAIATIRTALNYFLERDINRLPDIAKSSSSGG